MEDIIAKFEKVMDEYNEKYTQATTQLEQDKVNAEYEIKISAAEQVMETEFEAELKKQEEALEAEHKASEKELEEDSKEESSLEVDFKTFTAEELTKTYRIKDANNIAKTLNTTRPRENGKLVKELDYWKYLIKLSRKV